MAVPTDTRTFADIVGIFTGLISTALPVIAALAFLVFLKGLAQFIFKAGDAKNHAEGKNLMIWGLIALFLMLSFMGIISFFYHDIGFAPLKTPFPTLPEGTKTI